MGRPRRHPDRDRPVTRAQQILACCLADGVPRRSFWVALVVGTILNLINQGDLLLRGVAPDWLKLALTYLVPYCVATYGAVSLRLSSVRRTGCAAKEER